MNEPINPWDARYAGDDYLFGTAPNAFLVGESGRLKSGWRALAIADGEGRNGVWLAQQGLIVQSVDVSQVAIAKARKLAVARGVSMTFTHADLDHWDWPKSEFDLIVAIFVQFAEPPLRARIFGHIQRALKPGGLLLLEGYRIDQLAYGTGGPGSADNLYTEPMLRAAFPKLEIVELRSYDAVVKEGSGHNGMSALIDLVARRPHQTQTGLA